MRPITGAKRAMLKKRVDRDISDAFKVSRPPVAHDDKDGSVEQHRHAAVRAGGLYPLPVLRQTLLVLRPHLPQLEPQVAVGMVKRAVPCVLCVLCVLDGAMVAEYPSEFNASRVTGGAVGRRLTGERTNVIHDAMRTMRTRLIPALRTSPALRTHARTFTLSTLPVCPQTPRPAPLRTSRTPRACV